MKRTSWTIAGILVLSATILIWISGSWEIAVYRYEYRELDASSAKQGKYLIDDGRYGPTDRRPVGNVERRREKRHRWTGEIVEREQYDIVTGYRTSLSRDNLLTYWDDTGCVRQQYAGGEHILAAPWRGGMKDQIQVDPPRWVKDDELFR